MAVLRKFAQLGVPALLCATLSACGGGSSRSATPATPSLYMEGIASGFSGKLELSDNGQGKLSLSQAGPFRFPQQVVPGSSYDIRVVKQPPGRYCSVFNGSGKASGNVRDIEIRCVPGNTDAVYLFGKTALAGTQPTGNLVKVPGSRGNFYGTTSAGGSYGDGTLYEYNVGGTLTVLHQFQGGKTDGATPYGAPTPNGDGALYGVTTSGGIGGGTVYTVSPQGQESILHSFTGGADGSEPSSPLLRLSNGDLVGTTQQGGQYGFGTLYEISPSGSIKVLHAFSGGSAGLDFPEGHLLLASNGTIYGITVGEPSGGGSGVYAYNPVTQAYSRVWSFSGTGRSGPNGGLIQASDGMLYGVTAGSGAYGMGSVYRIDPTSGAHQVIYSFTGGADGSNPLNSLYQGDNGRLYVTTALGGANGEGTLGSIRTNGSGYELLVSYSDAADGLSKPQGPLVEGPQGYLYGLMNQGGSGGGGALYVVY